MNRPTLPSTISSLERKVRAEDELNDRMFQQAGINIPTLKSMSLTKHDVYDVGPNDSVSQVESREYPASNGVGAVSPQVQYSSVPRKPQSPSSSLVTASNQSSKQRTSRAKELKLAAELEIVKRRNECEVRKRLLQRQIEEDDDEESLRRAQQEIIFKQENVARLRRQRVLVEQQEKLRQKELEMDLKVKYELARSIADMYDEGPNVNTQSVWHAEDSQHHDIKRYDRPTPLSILSSQRDMKTNAQRVGLHVSVERAELQPRGAVLTDKHDETSNNRYVVGAVMPPALHAHETGESAAEYSPYDTIHAYEDVRKKEQHISPVAVLTEPMNYKLTEPYETSPSQKLKTEAYMPVKSTGPASNIYLQQQEMYQHGESVRSQSEPSTRNDVIDLIREQGNLAKLLLEHQVKATLPQKSITPFGGDPLEYTSFIRRFEHDIESKVQDEKDQLYYLDQYTVDDANKLVKSCMHQDKEKGYANAKALLKKRYGDGYKIANAFVAKAVSWSNLRNEDAAGLSRYSLFLTECCNVLQDLDQIHELDHTANIKTVICKLPYRTRDRWRTRVDQLMEQGTVVKFSHLTEFVEKQARIANNPVYGDISTKDGEDSKRKYTSGRPVKSYRVNTEREESSQKTENVCIFCQGTNHNLDSCFKLEKQPIEERLKFMKDNGLCFGCLKKATHFRKDCNRKLTCKKCSKRHPMVLHQQQDTQTSTLQPKQQDNKYAEKKKDIKPSGKQQYSKPGEKDKERSSCLHTHTGAGDSPSPSIVPVIIRSKSTGLAVQTLAYLDSGSDAVFCTGHLRQQLGMKGKRTKLQLKTMTDERKVDTCILQGLELCSMDKEHCVKLPNVYTQKSIPADTGDVVTQSEVEKWPYLQNVHLNKVTGCMTVGNNVSEVFEPWEVINSKNGGPYACKTILGWTVHGTRNVKKRHASSARISVGNTAYSSLDKQLVQMYNQDFSERIVEDVPENSQEDARFLKFVENSITYKDGHYQIGLPLKGSTNEELRSDIPNNKLQAEQRIGHLKRRFQRDNNFYEEYKTFMKETIDNGYATPVPEEELSQNKGRIWYLPHHGVHHPKKGKLRVVFDCSEKYKNFCLNSELMQGPNLTNTLVGVLMRFRQSPIALVGDIKAMYHQVQVQQKDHDLLRFLWWRDGNIERPLEEYRMCVHLFGATSSPAVANFALRRTAEVAMSSYSQEVANTILHNFYVDDCLRSVQTEAEAMSLVKDLQEVCHSERFHLTKWLSNSREVLKTIPQTDRAKDVRSLDLSQDPLPSDRTLGMQWNVQDDTFGYSIDLQDKPATRRGILSTVSSVYDPLGLIAPVILPAKQILQNLCQQRLGWDQLISCDYQIRWQKWLQEIPKLSEFEVDRCLETPNFGTFKAQLYHFCDASEVGYGTATYLRMENEDEKVHCSLLMSKSRVSPLKQISIPRLELTAATVAVKVNHMIQKELDIPIEETFFWTDSMTVLRYINNDSARFHTFVANRVALIRDGSEPSQWKYVDTNSNPADECSRGLSVRNFLRSTRWAHGPGFLHNPECQWPKNAISNPNIESSDDPEVKREATVNAVSVEDAMDRLLSYYSSWYLLRRAVARILRVKKFLHYKIAQRKAARNVEHHNQAQQQDEENTSAAVSEEHKEPETGGTGPLTISDLQDAEKDVIKYVQKRYFPEEIKALTKPPKDNEGPDEDKCKTKQTHSVKKTSSLAKLNPFMMDGILRVGGRLAKSALPEETKFLMILPKKSHVTELILEDIHRSTGHSGRSHMLACLNKKYWVISANAAARRIIHRCVICRRSKAKVGEQMMADLPAERLTPEDPPFTRVGVDYFGPFEVKRGRSLVKRYGVIFTCLSTRAIHLEKADFLDTDSCINAIRRFVSRRGQVRELISDNGTNFIGAEKELRSEIRRWNHAKIQDYLLQKSIDWRFNPPAASHFGGIWERQIRTVRKIMISIMQQQPLTDESLNTFFCEVETIVNSRPITTVSGDPGDVEALTPNHLLLLKGKPSLPPILANETGPYARKRWKQVQYLSDIFWKRWSEEYLYLLQKRQKWVRPRENFKVGDVVIIVDKSRPRNSWQLGRIVATMPAKDGLVRQVQVKTKSSTLVRPISKLCLLVESDN